MAVLVAVVTGGFHSAAKYCWAVDNIPDEEEVYPILYASSVGEYTCLLLCIHLEYPLRLHLL